MANKYTAIQKCINKFEELKNKAESFRDVVYLDGVLTVIESFKELEKEQIQKAFDDGIESFCQYDPERHGNEHPTGKQYFDKTFSA